MAILAGWLTGVRFWETMDVTAWALALGVLFSLPLTVGAIAIVETSWGPFARIRDDFDRIIHLFAECRLVDLALVSLLAGIGEEAIFRGVMQPYLTQMAGPAMAVVVTSVVFGALHLLSAAYAVGVTIIGVYLGLLLLWFDNLLVPMLVHGLYDFCALVYALKIRPAFENE